MVLISYIYFLISQILRRFTNQQYIKKMKVFCFVTILFVVAFFDAHSQDDILDQDTVLTLEAMSSMTLDELMELNISTGSFLESDLREISVNMTVITKEQIEASGARHLTEALEVFVPGFQAMVNKWNGYIWGMRGVASDRNTKFIFLVNGHKMNTESRDGAMTELDLGLLDDVEQIEVLRGPAGLVYGSGAIAGVINIVTKKYDSDGIQLGSKLTTWNMNTYAQELQVAVSERLSKKASIRIDLGARKSDGVGAEYSRIVGRPSWPASQDRSDMPSSGIPSAGSALSTPGNYKLGIDFSFGKLHVYSRWTQQVTNASGWFPVDVWPDVVGVPGNGNTERWVDGTRVNPNSYFGYTESWGNNRRQYVLQNISNQFEYSLPLGDAGNELEFQFGVDAMSNRIQLEKIAGYEADYVEDREVELFETFGERRYNLGTKYMVARDRKLNLAVGYQFNLYDIGNDLTGKNAQNEKGKHSIVKDVIYTNNACFVEGRYSLSSDLDVHAGLRYDLHTRTRIHGGVFSPKLGLIYSLSKRNSIQLFYQRSANNGSADNYEMNRYLIGDDGEIFEGEDYHFAYSYIPRDIIPPVTESILHELKPERSESIEFTVHSQPTDEIAIRPSCSYNTISDLIAWNQDLFRVVNTGKYQFINVDFDVKYISKKISFGLNHTFQQLVDMDLRSVEEQMTMPVFDGYDSTYVGSDWYYSPTPAKNAEGNDSIRTVTYNYIRDGITVDGKDFLSLSPNVTKVFVDYMPANWVTLHLSVRVFWGLAGRKTIHEYTPGQNEVLDEFQSILKDASTYNYYNIHEQPMFKVNAGAVLAKPGSKMKFSFHVYDLLAGNGVDVNLNSIRWNQSYNASTVTDYYAIDFISFAMKLTYDF